MGAPSTAGPHCDGRTKMAAVAFGFVVDGAPTERYTSGGGMEASVTFFGPASNRMLFLQYIFGTWRYANWQGITTPNSPQMPNGICYTSLPKPFVSLSEFMAGTESSGSKCFRPEYALMPSGQTASHCLWPDTWEVAPADPNLQSSFVACESPPSNENDPMPMNHPIDYTCNCYVTVHYRHKHNGSWPLSFYRYVSGVPTGGMPVIPPGTYIDVKTRTSGEVQTIEGQSIKYALPSGASWDAPTDDVKKIPKTLPVGISVGSIISTTQLDVTWSGVPFPPWSFIDKLQGRVNNEPFLGYPRESVCFLGAEWTTQGSFGCVTLYNMHYNFIVKTAQVQISESTPSDGDYEAAGVIPGSTAIGVWNRRASSAAIKYGNSIVTNYVPIATSIGDNPPFETTESGVDFWHLFTMKNHNGQFTNSTLACPG